MHQSIPAAPSPPPPLPRTLAFFFCLGWQIPGGGDSWAVKSPGVGEPQTPLQGTTHNAPTRYKKPSYIRKTAMKSIMNNCGESFLHSQLARWYRSSFIMLALLWPFFFHRFRYLSALTCSSVLSYKRTLNTMLKQNYANWIKTKIEYFVELMHPSSRLIMFR